MVVRSPLGSLLLTSALEKRTSTEDLEKILYRKKTGITLQEYRSRGPCRICLKLLYLFGRYQIRDATKDDSLRLEKSKERHESRADRSVRGRSQAERVRVLQPLAEEELEQLIAHQSVACTDQSVSNTTVRSFRMQ